MLQIKELPKKEDVEEVWNASEQKPVFLFKQSTTCPISAEAFNEFNSFLNTVGDDVDAFYVKVRETREVSNLIAEETNIQHQSPQAFLIRNKEVLWNASHTKITEESLSDALTQVK